jgi:hypothetical protein
MNKSKSYPSSLHNAEINLKKSNSLDNLNLDDFYFEEFFEGDGDLGIVFSKHNNNIIITNILPNTVASETYGLYKSMILIDIDNKDIRCKSLEAINKIIRKKWLQNCRIYLKFQKTVYKEIYTTLLNNNLIKYYDHFIELGTSSVEDFEFVEYDDLVKINMNREEIERFKQINPSIKKMSLK